MDQPQLVVNFRDLRVYQSARKYARRIFAVSTTFPREERYALTDQIRRASRSVHANVAEAWRKRRYPASFASKLSDADAEAAEVQSWLDSALDCHYIEQQLHDDLDDQYDHIGAQLNLMMEHSEKWCRNLANKRKPNPPK